MAERVRELKNCLWQSSHKLIVKYDSDDAQNNPLDNGFLVEYISEEGGRYYMQTIGQSFRIGL
ncbi:hypothetical protein CEH02_02040 [Streptococcus pyogenes]|nr:hypothetical protein CEH02_02040 [Streptococcus pyogenes]